MQKEALLITLGQDEGPTSANLKVWNLEGQAKSSTATPPLLKAVRLFTPKQTEAPVTVLAVHEENWPQMTLAAGLANGSIHVLRGDVGELHFQCHSSASLHLTHIVHASAF